MSRDGDLELRARRVRARATVRSWEYRQRRYSKGAWYLLRRALADARACWAVPESEAEKLVLEGYHPDPAGQALQPPKTILRLSAERIEEIRNRRAIRIGLTTELLEATCLVLEPFP